MSGTVGDNTARASGVIAAAGGGGMVPLVTTVLSSQASASFDGYFTSDYDVYVYQILNIVPADNDKDLYFRCRVANADVSSADYYSSLANLRVASGGSISENNVGGYRIAYIPFSNYGQPNSGFATDRLKGFYTLTCYNPLGAGSAPNPTKAYKSHRWQYIHPGLPPYNGHEPTYYYEGSGGGTLGYTPGQSALTGHTFYFNSGNIDTGEITLYGLKKA